MSDAKEERAALNERHAKIPGPGDYWHEMLSPVCVVIARVAGYVLVCRKTKSAGNDCWTWDLRESVLEVMRLDEFRKSLSYGTIPGYWAWVVPGCHKWASELVLASPTPENGEQP